MLSKKDLILKFRFPHFGTRNPEFGIRKREHMKQESESGIRIQNQLRNKPLGPHNHTGKTSLLFSESTE